MISSAEILEVDSSDEAALEALKGIPIPPCPEVVSRLLEEARQEEPDFSRVARLIGGDVALAAAVLKMANSPFFGLRRKIQSVKQAAAVLGLRNLLKIIYGVVLKQSLGGAKAPAMRRFWERSNYNAVVCTYFAARLSGVSIDDAYTFGLNHLGWMENDVDDLTRAMHENLQEIRRYRGD